MLQETAVTLQETVVTTALRLNFEFTPTHKKTAVSPKRHSRPAIKKPLFYKKSFLLSGRIAITPLPPFGWIIFHILAQGRKSISKKEERNINQSNPCDSSLFIIVETHKFASLLSKARTLQRNPNCRVIRNTKLVLSVGAVAASLLCRFHD